MTPGRLDVTIKINELPTPTPIANGWQRFAIDCEGREVSVSVRPKIWNKLVKASQEYPLWVAAITGKMGADTDKGFVLEQPGVQVFEKKPKEAKAG